MKKATWMMAICSALFFISLASHAQDVTGKNFVNAGIGLGSFGMIGTGGIPITFSVEHGFKEKISAGIYVGIVSKKYAEYWKYRYVIAGVRGSYHFNELLKLENDKVDIYGGATLFYRGYKFKYTGSETPEKTSGGSIDFALHAGGRYMFSENVGGFAEVGYGISPLQLGLTVRL